MRTIKYVEGDATQPQGPGPKLIAHCCNDIGGWGSGFVVALSKRWKTPEQWYRAWHRGSEEHRAIPFELGEVLFVPVEIPPQTPIWVANIIGQHKTKATSSVPPIRYEALTKGFHRVREFCQDFQNFNEEPISVHMPRIGAVLAGGDWDVIQRLIHNTLVAHGIEVTVYDLPGQPFVPGIKEHT